MERGVASRDCGANRSAGGPGPRPSGRGLTRAGRSSAPVPLPEAAARVPGRKSPRRSAERASRLQRDGPRFAHAVVAPRTRDIREECACRRSATPSLGRTRKERNDADAERRRGMERNAARLKRRTAQLIDTDAAIVSRASEARPGTQGPEQNRCLGTSPRCTGSRLALARAIVRRRCSGALAWPGHERRRAPPSPR